jgi:hypothetical protein
MYELSVKQDFEIALRRREAFRLVNETDISIIHKEITKTERMIDLLPEPTDPGCGAPRNKVARVA